MGNAILNVRRAKVPQYGLGGFFSGAMTGASSLAGLGPLGAVGGALLGGIFGSSSENKQEKELARQRAEEEARRLKLEQQIKDENSRAILASYPTNGIAAASYYAKYGGKINLSPLMKKYCATGGSLARPNMYPTGGQIVPLASDAGLVQGDTHAQDTNGDGATGVTLSNSQGQPMAEVENDEVIINDKVFSKQLGFAEPAQMLATKKGMYEPHLQDPDQIKVNTATRNIQKIDQDIDALYAQQEVVAQQMGLREPQPAMPQEAMANTAGMAPPMATGGRIPKYEFGNWSNLLGYDRVVDPNEPQYIPGTEDPHTGIGTVNPNYGKKKFVPSAGSSIFDIGSRFVDNITNQKLILNTPQITPPTLERTVPLKANFNINPQLNEAARARIGYATDLGHNTASSVTANAMKAKLYAEQLDQSNKLYGTKENTETGLYNQAAQNAQGVQNRNLARLAGYDTDVFDRRVAIQQARSANAANLQQDLAATTLDRKAKQLEDAKIALNVKAASLDNDAALRQTFTHLAPSLTKGSPDYNNWRKIASEGGTAAKQLWNAQFPKDPLPID